MKVCVIGTRGFPFIQGGVEKHCEMLYPQLKNVEVTVFRRKPYVTDSSEYENIKFIDLPSTKIKGFEAVLHSLLASIYAIWIKPDVVHFHNIGPALFSPLIKIFSIPVVLTYHSPNYEHKKWGKLARMILKFSERIALTCADRIIFVNKFQRDKFSEQVLQKSVYIPNGIDVPLVPTSRNYLEECGLLPGKYILSVGRITQEKGFHTLVKAFQASGLTDLKLVIAGSADHKTDYLEQLMQMAEDFPIVFPGYVYGDALAQLYAHAAIYVLASENEGFPLVLLEAMSHGCNILASDIPGAHLVKLPEQNYFSVGDYKELSNKMKECMQKSSKMSYDLSDFSWKEIAMQTVAVFEDACSN